MIPKAWVKSTLKFLKGIFELRALMNDDDLWKSNDEEPIFPWKKLDVHTYKFFQYGFFFFFFLKQAIEALLDFHRPPKERLEISYAYVILLLDNLKNNITDKFSSHNPSLYYLNHLVYS